MLDFCNLNSTMINPGNCDPIYHRNPRPRIDTSPVQPEMKPEYKIWQQVLADHAEAAQRRLEAERIWGLVKEGAGGVVATPEEKPEQVVSAYRIDAGAVYEACILTGTFFKYKIRNNIPYGYMAREGWIA